MPMNLRDFGFPGCELATAIDIFSCTITGTIGLERGYAYVDLPVPVREPGSAAYAMFGQWLVLDPTPGSEGVLSDAMAWYQ